jgi:predicted porin
MQKKIIALAVAGLVSGAAFAQQSNVTIYGVVDHYYANGKNDDSVNTFNAGGLSGSRIGFKGVEALGNGLSAVYTLEYGLTSDVNAGLGAGGSAARQSFVGLTGGFGTAVIGRLQTPGYNFGVKYDAMGASIFSPVGQLSDNNTGAGIGLSISGRDALARQDNAVAYVSPNMSGFTVVGAYAFGTGGEATNVGGATDPQNIFALSVDYDMGPLSVGFTHHNVNDFGNASGTDQTENAIGVNYDFGIAKLSGSYQTSKTDTAAAVGNVADVRLWNIGARFKAGANGTVGVAYGRMTDKAPANDLRATSWAVDYQYALSKRTTAYAGYSRISNDSNTNYVLQNLGATFIANNAAGDNNRQFAVGLRHTF